MKLKYYLFIALLLFATGCIDPYAANTGSGWSSPPDPYYDPYRRDDYYRRAERDRLRDERRETQVERRRLEDERRRADQERRQLEEQRRAQQQQARERRQERCPSGFSPSERKCSSEERRRGCKDMRLPGGLGCVKR